jgi:hypothetical protein
MVRAIFAALLAAGLAGCVTAAHTLDVEEVRSLRLERVDLVLDPAAKIDWISLQSEYAESLKRRGDGEATAQTVIETAGFRAYAMTRIQSKVRQVLEPALRSTLAGSRPVIAKVTVHGVRIPGFVEGAIKNLTLGPGATQSEMGLTIDFLEGKTGRPILTYPRGYVATSGTQWVDLGITGAFAADPIERMMNSLANRVPAWLLKA